MEFHLTIESAGVLISFLLFLYCILKWKNSMNTTAKPPQPSGSLPIIGHLHLLGGLPHIALGRLADKYGPIFMIKLGVHRALVVSTAETAKECLGANDKVFLNRPYTMFAELLGYNSAMFGLAPYGQYWREIRKITTVELLSNHQIEMFKDIRFSEIRSAIKRTSSSGEMSELVDMKQWFKDISLNTVVRTVLGKSLKENYQDEEYTQCLKAIREFFVLGGAFVPADALPFLRWLDIGGYEKKMKKAALDIDVIAQNWLEEHRRRRRSKETQEKRYFMDAMLDIMENTQENVSKFEADTIIKATCMAMILGGADSTAATLTWALSLLLNNKDVLKKTQAELDIQVGKNRQVEESDLKNLVYLQAVLKETMRLYPAAPLSVPREAIINCTVNGYHISAGTRLYVNLYKVHRDPKVWEDPLEFRPERFLTTYKEYDVRGQQFEYMPFGSGRRICPGISSALRFMQFTLAKLLHAFEVTILSDEAVDMTEGFGLTNLKATPLEVILTHRLPQNFYI